MRWLPLVMLVGCASAGESPKTPDASGGGRDAAVLPDAPGLDAKPQNPCAFTGALATYTFAGETGTQASTAVASTAAGFTAGPFTRAATLTATSGSSSINSSNWPTAAQVDPTKFYSFTLSPPQGCSMTISTIAIDAKSSGTGPATGALATSSDNYATFKTVSTGAPSTPAVGVTSSGMIEVRVYGYSASSTSGTLRVQGTLTINGSGQ